MAVKERAAPRRELLGEFVMSPAARQRDGSMKQWAQTAREAVALYFAAIERNPESTITLTITETR